MNSLKRILGTVSAIVMAASAIAGTVPAATAADTSNDLNGVSANLLAAEKVTFSETSSDEFEQLYATWEAVNNATGYNAYVDGTKVDSELVRLYDGKMRVDVPGLKAGSHTLKVVPLINGSEDASKAAEQNISVIAHDRSGFAFVNGTSSGAYNDDGTLKSNAQVIYVTDANKDTVTLKTVDKKGKEITLTGVQNIITGLKSNTKCAPLDIRFIGNITDPGNMAKGDLMVDTATAGLTVEGIGKDTTFNGFGLVLKNSSNVEVRNIGFMNCNSSEGDDIGLQQGNDHIWVHNCDLFYGDAGSDADQVKGDGALDTKTSTYITHSYNHFHDNGKCNLQGMKSEKTTNYITYHHNWYDHSDSRHPRIRTCTVHTYNNYFDGNAKYGVGVTLGASCFVENNYFRNCKYPMLISMQGSDIAQGEGTFSGENGGVIKSYGNKIEGSLTKSYVTYQKNNTEFDAYEASSRDEKVPSSVTAKQGGTTYNNFDTDSSIMYKYTVDTPDVAREKCEKYAGRVQGGAFKWDFNNSVDDESYAVNTGLKAALTNYKGGEYHGSTGGAVVTTVTADPGKTTTTTAKPVQTTSSVITTKAIVTTTKGGSIATTAAPVPAEGDIYVSPNGTGDGKTASTPSNVVSAISAITPGHTIWLEEGTYKFSDTILIDQNNSGKAGAYKTIRPYNNANVTFDFSGQGAAGPSKRGIVLDGSYWYFYGFEITKAADNGILLSGNNNVIDYMVFNDNQDSGLQISRYRTDANSIADWPSNNLIKNSTSKNNCDDKTMENADGFAAKLTCGEGNVFDGCISYNNSDDGWDLFAKTETGPIGVITIKNCVSARNGFTEYGEGFGDCDGNGFKLGGSGVGTAHIVENCLAFENLHSGFTDNNNPKLGTIKNCTAVNNGLDGSKANFMAYRCTDPGCNFDSVISFYTSPAITQTSKGAALNFKPQNDKFNGTITNSIYYNSGYYLVKDKTSIKNGDKVGTKASTNPALASVVNQSALDGLAKIDFHKDWRNADGSINAHGYFETAKNSDYYTMGYHFTAASDVPIVTTTTGGAVTTTTTTAKVTTTAAPVTTEAPKTTAAPTKTDVPSTTVTKTTTTTDTGVVEHNMWGDVDENGEVTIADAVMLNRYITGSISIDNQGKANANLYVKTGDEPDKIDSNDVEIELQYLVQIVLVGDLPITVK